MINDSHFTCLLIETSTDKGVVSCWKDQKIAFCRWLPFGHSQSKYLMSYLVQEMQAARIDRTLLSCIAVGIGPGSYTGIRVGEAIAQALAFSWQLPLIGLASLWGFIPDEKGASFAAIIDARIGGAYVQKGICDEQRKVKFFSSPEVLSLDALGPYLKEVRYLITPSAHSIKPKMEALYPENRWIWQEKEPAAESLFAHAYDKWSNEEIASIPLELLYLRKTEAERQKETKFT